MNIRTSVRRFFPFILTIPQGLFFILLFSSAFAPPAFDRHEYQIETSSELLVHGSSNVNEFTCDCSCTQDFNRSSLEITQGTGNHRFDFSNASLKINTTSLDCGHKIMNKDLYETLQAKNYPNIIITLLQAEVPTQGRLVSQEQWVSLQATTRITIAGKNRRVLMPVKARKMKDQRYQFKGEVDLHMTDFGLEPPKAMLGLIKVNDGIKIQMDLVVSLLDN